MPRPAGCPTKHIDERLNWGLFPTSFLILSEVNVVILMEDASRSSLSTGGNVDHNLKELLISSVVSVEYIFRKNQKYNSGINKKLWIPADALNQQ